MMNKDSLPYKTLCAEYYELERPTALTEELRCYLKYAEQARGPILEPMCGTGRFLIPLMEHGYTITGFDYSPHMLNICRQKCEAIGLTPTLSEATFRTFALYEMYNLIFIPSGSFCHLTSSEDISQALKFVSSRLNSTGKFIVEIETINAVREPQGVWTGNWVNRANGSKIIRNVFSRFDEISQVETAFFRYELWEENAISKIEVENFYLKRYEPEKIEKIFDQHGLTVIGKWGTKPHYSQTNYENNAKAILYECVKH